MTRSAAPRSPAAPFVFRRRLASASHAERRRARTTADGLVEVALPLPLFTTFSYRVGRDYANAIVPGSRVVVPFRNRKEIGVCVGFTEPTDATRRYKEVLEVPDAEPAID